MLPAFFRIFHTFLMIFFPTFIFAYFLYVGRARSDPFPGKKIHFRKFFRKNNHISLFPLFFRIFYIFLIIFLNTFILQKFCMGLLQVGCLLLEIAYFSFNLFKGKVIVEGQGYHPTLPRGGCGQGIGSPCTRNLPEGVHPPPASGSATPRGRPRLHPSGPFGCPRVKEDCPV